MPIDTRAKRQSCYGLGLPFARPGLTPDGTIDAGDRAHLNFLYRRTPSVSPAVQFYPDAHPETTSVDGYAERSGGTSWADTHDGAGTFGDGGDTFVTTLRAAIETDGGGTVDVIQRAILLFDSSTLPNAATVVSASVNVFVDTVQASFGGSVVICSCTPSSNTAVAASDYGNFGAIAFSAAIPLSGFTSGAYKTIPLNAAGMAAVSLTGVTKFGLRIYSDFINTPPSPATGSDRLWIVSRDSGGLTQGPYLEVRYDVGTIPNPVIGKWSRVIDCTSSNERIVL